MQNTQSIELLNKMIYTKRGIKKALDHTNKRAMFKNNYNKGYIEALNEDLKCLTELRTILENEQNQSFIVKLDSIRKEAR